MVEKKSTPQEEFWAGDFGTDYISRNRDPELLASNLHLFSEVFSLTDSAPGSILELGANIGMNLKAIKQLSPTSECTAIEINPTACEILKAQGFEVIESSILGAEIERNFDFVFSKGVLIHLNPEQLAETYRRMFEWSTRFILIAEYYNPTPVSIPYSGNADKLFKRDFAGEFMDLYPDVKLRKCGFAYHRGAFPQDDITWFLLEK